MYSVAIKPSGCHTAGMQHSNYAIHSIVFRPQNWQTLVLSEQRDRETQGKAAWEVGGGQEIFWLPRETESVFCG